MPCLQKILKTNGYELNERKHFVSSTVCQEPVRDCGRFIYLISAHQHPRNLRLKFRTFAEVLTICQLALRL